jgi:penicillin V acylase-like amidase (Ntn superfamily)
VSQYLSTPICATRTSELCVHYKPRSTLLIMYTLLISAVLGTFAFLLSPTYACSRVNYNSGAADGNRIMVGRSMDWLENTNSSFWLFPAGMKRSGYAGKNSVTWTSTYGSVITSMYDLATVDGMNSKGLVGNVLYLADGDYGTRDNSIPGLSIGLWQQYFLDKYATVKEAVDDVYTEAGKEKFQIATKEIVPGVPSLGHLSLTDPSGDSAIMEYLEGKLVVHHAPKYTVMTNDPSFDEQLAISAYWGAISNYSLPGTDRPADRFARLAHYVTVIPGSKDAATAAASTAGMIRAVSVPLEPISVKTPNIAATLWRVYSDTKALTYYYESATDPMGFWVELSQLDLSAKGKVMVLKLKNVDWKSRVGDMTSHFTAAEPFQPLEVDDA